MNKFIRSIVFSIATMGAMTISAIAAPVVQTGSTYSLYVEGQQSGNAAAGIFTFDGIPATIDRPDGQTLTVNESETELSETSSQINITLRSDADLFPVFDETAILGIGIFVDNLDLLFPVRLDDARIIFLTSQGEQIAITDNLASQVSQWDPWDGFFPSEFDLLGVDSVGGRNVTIISFQFVVSTVQADVPEPGTAMLSGLGLLAVAAGRRRRRQYAGA